jgi:hypothetical protein
MGVSLENGSVKRALIFGCGQGVLYAIVGFNVSNWQFWTLLLGVNLLHILTDEDLWQ